MRMIILAATAFTVLLGATAAEAKSEKGCRAKGTCELRNTAAIKACGAQWQTAKADEAVKAKGWPAFWSACAKEAKLAKTVAP